MKLNRCREIFTLLLVCGAAISLTPAAEPTTTPSPKPATMPATTLTVDVEGGKSVSFTANDLEKLPHQEVKVKDRDGTVATFSGVTVSSLLIQAGAPLGPKQLRGSAMSLYMIAQGADGYAVTFGIAELSPDFQTSAMLVADARNGVPLDAASGPFRLIAPQDAKPGRWVRMLVSLRIRRAEK